MRPGWNASKRLDLGNLPGAIEERFRELNPELRDFHIRQEASTITELVCSGVRYISPVRAAPNLRVFYCTESPLTRSDSSQGDEADQGASPRYAGI